MISRSSRVYNFSINYELLYSAAAGLSESPSHVYSFSINIEFLHFTPRVRHPGNFATNIDFLDILLGRTKLRIFSNGSFSEKLHHV